MEYRTVGWNGGEGGGGGYHFLTKNLENLDFG